MNRIRQILYEGAVIILVGVSIAFLITLLLHFFHRPTIADFVREYSEATGKAQVAVADKYLDLFPLPDLLKAIDVHYSAIGCHIQGHAIGRAVYKRNPNFSDVVQKCGGACTYACFHGAMMQMFDTESDTLGGVIEDETPAQYMTHLKDIARDLCTRPDVQSVVRVRQCYHGLGHVFAYNSGRDLKSATESCNIFDPRAAFSCRTGAYMEYVLSSTSTSPEYDKSAEPCDAFPKSDAYICYRYKGYAWLRAYGTIAAAMKACDTFGDRTIDCISGTASAAASPERLATKEGIDHICGSLKGIQYRACLAGAFLNIINLNSGDDSEHVCDIVTPAYRDQCLGVRAKFQSKIYYDNK